jgi:hypothetical protein
VSLEVLERILTDGTIKIPEMAVIATGIVMNKDLPPEVEVRFDMKENIYSDNFVAATEELICMESDMCEYGANKTSKDMGEKEGEKGGGIGKNVGQTTINNVHAKLSINNVWNWQLRFVHNQLFKYLQNSNRFCPGPFHMTYVRKATWKDNNARKQYFDNCEIILSEWEKEGPRLLTSENSNNTDNINIQKEEIDGSRISGVSGIIQNPLNDEITNPYGVYLFKDRNTVVKYFKPNFFPPYDTVENTKIILESLSKKWDEKNLCWIDLE